MSALAAEVEQQIDALLAAPTFSLEPAERQARLLRVLQNELSYAAERNERVRHYLDAWPTDYRGATSLADLPYLPVGAFKASPPLMLTATENIVRTLASSATTGQTPSRVALDAPTSRRMIKGVVAIASDFIGPRRRPYLVIDTAATLAAGGELGARAAAIQGLRPFATEMACCLSGDGAREPRIDESLLAAFAAKCGAVEVLAYGFTYVIWQHFVRPLRERGIRLQLPNIRVLHSGGWKRLQEQAVSRAAFAAVIVRDPLTLRPVAEGQQGLVQVCSALPTSFPGFLVLTDDIAEVIHYDGCACGRRGISFRFVKRVPQAEVRGCGNIETLRQRPVAA